LEALPDAGGSGVGYFGVRALMPPGPIERALEVIPLALDLRSVTFPEGIDTIIEKNSMSSTSLTKAIAYFRTSSETNLGQDKDSPKRQREAIVKYARAAGFEVIAEYSDDGIKGADPVDQRPGFADMMKHIASNGVHTIIVETANRFARDLIVQETGWRFLKDAGINLIAADSPHAFLDETPTAVMIRQILGSISQFEKAMLVAKLKGARDRKRRDTGEKCGGRKTYAERNPGMVALAKKLARYTVNGRKRSLRDVAAELAAAGYTTKSGNPYAATAISRMISA
jgi:DNA invertase Pin-like site-specific DNA recombinase